MKKYTTPEIEICVMSVNDIITVSQLTSSSGDFNNIDNVNFDFLT